MRGRRPRPGSAGNRPSTGLRAVAVFALAVALASAPPAHAGRSGYTNIVGGTPSTAHPSTGALLVGTDPGAAVSWCSGVLIGCRTVLTAAHCVCEGAAADCLGPRSPSGRGRLVFLPHAGFFHIASITVHPEYRFPHADLAMLRLATSVTGVKPAPLGATAPPIGTPGTIVGFGRTGGPAQDLGLERVGAITVGSCGAGETDETEICWAYDGAGANSCQGDSGGPLFCDLGAGPRLVGITSGGQSDSCLAGDLALDTKVAAYLPWIEAEAGSDATRTRCGGMPQVDEPGTKVLALGGALGDAVLEQTYTIDVPPGTNELRVALNGIDDGLANFDLFVRAGASATPTRYDCRAAGAGQYAYCGFDFPTAGPWSLLVDRRAGAGPYQLTATLVGGQPPMCGNAVRETAEECDGTDDATCPGACDASCRCPTACAQGGVVTQKALLHRRFFLQTLLRNDAGEYDALDPRVIDFGLSVEGAGPLSVDIHVPAGDGGWAGSAPEANLYRWAGAIDGARHVRLRCKHLRTGDWEVRLSGRALR